mmetsp:Transcript_9215/g.17594  ORF Transcript_9215/g.17594 Transcript_9215/m.17594 type:complete len:382 (-) Transcript_9215:110-1255(-)
MGTPISYRRSMHRGNYSGGYQLGVLLFSWLVWCDTAAAAAAASSSSNGRPTSWFGKRYEPMDEDWSGHGTGLEDGPRHPLRIVSGREFDLFDSRDESSRPRREVASKTERDLADVKDTFYKSTRHGDDDDDDSQRQGTVCNVSTIRNSKKDGSYPSYSFNAGTSSRVRKFSEYGRSSQSSTSSSGFSLIPPPVAEWWTRNVTPNVKTWPKLQCRIEPTTTLKIRKTFRPLKTIVQLGADFNTQLGVWQFKSSWEDAIIGGKLTLAGRELQLTKSWQLSVGAVEDLVTRLRLRAAVDLQTWKAYARVGFRTERLAPINMMEGFTLMKQVPLDGSAGHIKLEIKANFALPEPEIEYSTESNRSIVGMGNIEVSIEELNLVLDY